MSLEEVRRQIDLLDDQIVALLAQRQQQVARAASCKADEARVRAPDRRASMMARLNTRAVALGVAPEVVAQVYTAAIDGFTELELRVHRSFSPSPTADVDVDARASTDRSAAVDLMCRLHREQNAFYAGDDDTGLRSLLSSDIVWQVPGSNPIAGTYRGIDDVFAYFARRRSLAGNTMRMHPGELLVGDGEHVASLTDGTATIGGTNYSWATVGLYRIRSEQIAACWLLPLDPTTFDLVWNAAA